MPHLDSVHIIIAVEASIAEEGRIKRKPLVLLDLPLGHKVAAHGAVARLADRYGRVHGIAGTMATVEGLEHLNVGEGEKVFAVAEMLVHLEKKHPSNARREKYKVFFFIILSVSNFEHFQTKKNSK